MIQNIKPLLLLPIMFCIVFTSCKDPDDTEGTLANPKVMVLQIDLGTMTDLVSGWRKLLYDIERNGKYVALDLSACTMNGTDFNPDGNIKTGKDKIVSIILPDAAKSMNAKNINGSLLFEYFTVLRSATLPEGFISIGDSVFNGCTNLKQLTMPAGMFSVGDAFYKCRDLIFILTGSGSFSVIENGRALVQNTELVTYPSAKGSITLPEGITSIGRYAFSAFSITQITLPNSITSIGESAFYCCSYLTSATLPDSLTSIGKYAFAFTKIAQINLPESLTSIDINAFLECPLTQITLPKNLTSINGLAFQGCENLALITSLAEEPPSITNHASIPPSLNTGTFYNIKNLQHIKVPAGSIDAYKTATGWSEYADIITAIE